MINFIYFALVISLTSLGCAPSIQEFISQDISQQELKQHIKYLASDALQGRKSGEEGNNQAARYIADQFKTFGLLPAGDDNSYFQNFSFIAERKIGKRNKFNIMIGETSIDVKLNEEYNPLTISVDTVMSSSLVFVGFGIAAPDSLHYDDYAGIDVKNKIVACLRYSPDTSNDSKYEQYSNMMAKLFTARDKGAAGIIFITNPPGTRGDKLVTFDDPRLGLSTMAVLTMKWNEFNRFMNLAGKNLNEIKGQIESSKTPSSFEIPKTMVSLETEIEKVTANSSNVIGYLSGTDSLLKNEVLVIGAHFDHLGLGGNGSGSLKPDTIAPHFGADDNASGTAAVLELAQYFSAQQHVLKRSIVFIAFTGEELGVLGSDYYVKHPVYPLNKTIVMINMDMIGRMKDSILVIEGMGTSPKFEELVKRYNSDSLSLRLKPDGFGPSDQASFYKKDIPVMFFFTNLHSDYHKPSDTWDKINYSGEQKVIEFASRIVKELCTDTARPLFTKAVSTPMGMGGDRQGSRVSLGIIPDFAGDTPGMKISGTRPGSPAEKAGLKADDIIIKFGGREIKNIYDFTYILGQSKPGDEVEIIVKRGNDEVTLKAKLEAKQ